MASRKKNVESVGTAQEEVKKPTRSRKKAEPKTEVVEAVEPVVAVEEAPSIEETAETATETPVEATTEAVEPTLEDIGITPATTDEIALETATEPTEEKNATKRKRKPVRESRKVERVVEEVEEILAEAPKAEEKKVPYRIEQKERKASYRFPNNKFFISSIPCIGTVIAEVENEEGSWIKVDMYYSYQRQERWFKK